MKKTLHTMALAIAITGLVAGAAGAQQIQTAAPLTLEQCVTKAIAQAPELGEVQADIALMTSKLNEAKGYRAPRIELTSLLGPAPGANKQDITSYDSPFRLRDTTWFASTDLVVTQPLWTFGKISENMKAASHGIEVDRSKKVQKVNEVTLEVKKYYYGLLLARELKSVVHELQDFLETGRNKVQELLAKESDAADQTDLYKIDAYAGEINKYLEEAIKGEQLALAALKTRIGLPPKDLLLIADQRLAMPSSPLALHLDEYITRARADRPEFRQLSEGIAARGALVRAAKAEYYPDLFVAGMASWAFSDGRDRIDNPYITDRFQHAYAGVALGLRWKLDFGISSSKVAGEQAQLDRLMSTRTYANQFIPLQVTKAWLEMQEASRTVTNAAHAYQSAKKWGAAALANFDFGIGSSRDVFEAVAIYGKMKAAHYQAIYDYRLAEANLDYAVGTSTTKP